MNVLANVNLKSRMRMKDAKTIHFVSAVPETQTSSITSEAFIDVGDWSNRFDYGKLKCNSECYY